MIQIEILTNVNSIERNEDKDKYNWTLTNRWSDQKTQSNHETVSKILCKLSIK